MNVTAIWYPLGPYSVELDAHAISLGWDDGFGRPMLKLSVGVLWCWIEVSLERDLLKQH